MFFSMSLMIEQSDLQLLEAPPRGQDLQVPRERQSERKLQNVRPLKREKLQNEKQPENGKQLQERGRQQERKRLQQHPKLQLQLKQPGQNENVEEGKGKQENEKLVNKRGKV